jgi:hypothetical protein
VCPREAPCVGIDAESRLARLLRGRAPLRRALARIAGRLVETRAWERLGFARLADYARERTGLSARQLQDLAHVDARLAELPALEQALADGAIAWTRARLVARVATREDETRWLAFARRVSTRALEREVRAVDRGSIEAGGLESDDEGRPAYPRAGVIVRCTPQVQAQFHRARQLARRVAGEALPPWACMEAVAAEALAALGLANGDDAGEAADDVGEVDAGDACGGDPVGGASWADRAGATRAANACAGRGLGTETPEAESTEATRHDPAHRAANACATQGRGTGPVAAGPIPHALLDGLAVADAFELDARLRRAIALEQRLEAEAAPLLRLAAAARLHRVAGFPSFEGWVRERFGLAPRKAHALVRLARASEACPALHAAFSEARLSWVQAHVLIPLLLLPDAEPFREGWIGWAQQISVRRLEEDVDAALRLAETDREAFVASGGLVERGNHRLELQTRARARESEATSPDIGEPAFASWGANHPRVARAHRVFERDGWRRVRCGGTAPAGLRFELGIRAGRPPLLAYGPGERKH